MAVQLEPDDDTDTTEQGAPAPAADEARDDVWQPPTREQFEKMRRDLAKANAESKTRREQLAELQRATEDADGKLARERAEAAEAKYKPIAVRAAARAAFLEAGLTAGGDAVAKLVRMLDLDGIEISDSGDVVGLDDQVAALKADFPALFSSPKPRPPRLDTGSRPAAAAAPKSSAERIAEQVLGSVA